MANDSLTRIKRQGLDTDDLSTALGISSLDTRVTALESTAIPAADWQQAQTDISNLQTGLTTANTNISTLNTTVSGHTTSISTLNTEVAELAQKINNTEIILGTINLTNVNVTQAALTARAEELGYSTLQTGYVLFDLDNHEWVYNGTQWADTGSSQAISVATTSNAGIVKFSSDNLKINGDANGVMEVNGLSTALSGKASQSDMTQAQSDISSLSTTVSGHTTSIGTLTTDVSALDTTVSGHTTSISTLSGDLSDLQGTVTTQGQTLSGLQTTVAGKQDALTAGDGISISSATISVDMTELLAHLVVNETLGNTPDGSRKAFTLAYTPTKIMQITRDGQEVFSTEDYSISGTTVTFVNAPATGSRLKATYWKA